MSALKAYAFVPDFLSRRFRSQINPIPKPPFRTRREAQVATINSEVCQCLDDRLFITRHRSDHRSF